MERRRKKKERERGGVVESWISLRKTFQLSDCRRRRRFVGQRQETRDLSSWLSSVCLTSESIAKRHILSLSPSLSLSVCVYDSTRVTRYHDTFTDATRRRPRPTRLFRCKYSPKLCLRCPLLELTTIGRKERRRRSSITK